VVEGVTTNLPFLRWLVSHPAFRAADVSTDFLARYAPLSPPPAVPPPGPWTDGWRLNLPRAETLASLHLDAAAGAAGAARGDGRVTAPMPGRVLEVRVDPGDSVASHQPLVVLEAMKMEQVVTAPFDGDVRSVDVRAGEQVASGTVLVTLETA